MTTEEIVTEVRSANQARRVIAGLLLRFGRTAAQSRIWDFARFSRQTAETAALRTAGNLLTSFVDRKPEGYVNY